MAPLPHDVEEWPDVFEDRKTLIFYHALPILVFGVEFCTFHTVVPGLVAGSTGFVTIDLTNARVNELILDAVTVALRKRAFSHLQLIAISTV